MSTTQHILDLSPANNEWTLLRLAQRVEDLCPEGRRAVSRYITAPISADVGVIVADLRAALVERAEGGR